ncbi:hypothetical protein C8J57DRAFT_1257323 [Mycena rebaudengoi]|nr:hypothetical protein C8J57DRAFT_1257323 [Mycena rebaudengoi]
MFTQDWHPNLYDLPAHLKRMLAMERKYGTTFDTFEPSREIREALPLWHHVGANTGTRQLIINHRESAFEGCTECTFEDHFPGAQCECDDCENDKDAGCRNPHACAVAVRDHLGELLPKWDPRAPNIAVRINAQDEEENSPLVFRPPPSITHIAEGLRVFTKNVTVEEIPQPATLVLPGETRRRVVLNGTCLRTGQANAQASAGIWYEEGDPQNKSLKLPETFEQTISSGEFAAALYAVQTAPLQIELDMEFERKTVIDAVSKMDTYEDHGWIGVKDSALLRALAVSLREREAETTLKQVDEPTVGTAGAAQLAIEACGSIRI